MTDATTKLGGARVLVLEDDYYLATDLQDALEAAGAVVIGPFADEGDAGRSLADSQPDCAFVDVNLGHGPSFDLPRELLRRAVPFAFVTGYDAGTIPAEFERIEKFEKPVEARKVATIAAKLLDRNAATSR